MFDLNKFRKTEFKPREDEITLSSLAEAGFGDGKFILRGLTATEISLAEEASTKGKLASDLLEKLVSAENGKQKAAALLEGIGVCNDIPAALAKRCEHIAMATVKPKLEFSDVSKLGEIFPIEFNQIGNKILELTGQGQEAVVKRRGSGKAKT